MSLRRYVLAALAGVVTCYWALFLYVAWTAAHEIYFDGIVLGRFMPGYLASLYAPPVIAIILICFAVRRGRTHFDA